MAPDRTGGGGYAVVDLTNQANFTRTSRPAVTASRCFR